MSLETLYVKMLPYNPKAGYLTRTFSMIDPTKGASRRFIAGDPEWYAVGKIYGEMLRKQRVHFYRPDSKQLFMVCTAEEAEQYDRSEAQKRAAKKRRAEPSWKKARDLTSLKPGSPVDQISGSFVRDDDPLTETEELHLQLHDQGKQINKLQSMVEALLPGGVQPSDSAPAPTVSTPVSRREAALGLTDDADGDSDTQPEIPIPDHQVAKSDLTIIHGIGPSTASKLHRMGYSTYAALGECDAETLVSKLEAADARVSLIGVRAWIAASKEIDKASE